MNAAPEIHRVPNRRPNAARVSAFNRNSFGLKARPRREHLRRDECDLWRVDLDRADADAVVRLRAVLSCDEEARAQRFRFERDRWRFVVGRGTLRVLIGSYLGCSPGEVVFRYGANGKPALAFPAEEFHFNVTHSEGLAVCAFSHLGPLGVDIERIRDLPDWESIALACFRPGEATELRALGEPTRRTEFFRRWTRQEAALKSSGIGLGGIGAIAAEATPPVAYGAVRSDSIRPSSSSAMATDSRPRNVVRDLDLGGEFAGALSAPADVAVVRWNIWPSETPANLQDSVVAHDAREPRIEFL